MDGMDTSQLKRHNYVVEQELQRSSCHIAQEFGVAQLRVLTSTP